MVTAQQIEAARREYVDAIGTTDEQRKRDVLVRLVQKAKGQR